MTAFGSSGTCTAQCKAEDGQTWQELGECLSKRVEVVVCKPEFAEIGRNESQASGSASASASVSVSGSGSATGSGVAQQSTGAAASTTVGVVHATVSKAGIVVFAILAFGSAAGMLL